MKTIKLKSSYLLSTALFLSLVVTSCDLNEIPTSFVEPKDYYQSKEQCEAGLNACYIPLNPIFNYTYLIAMEGCTDLMYVASGTHDAQLAISPANPLFGSTMWTQGYKGVMYANSVVAGIQRAPLADGVKLPMLAEGMVMRAFYYYFLTSTFGDVPFYTDDVTDEVVLERVSHLGRMPAKDTRDYLIRELQEYVPLMAQVRSCDVENNRCGAAMGWMLIAKMAMWNKQWETARDAILELEKIYGDLSQYDYADVMFRNKNSPESIFEIQHTYSVTGLKYTSSIAAICMPKRDKDDIYDGLRIPELGNQATTWTSLRPNTYYFASLQPKDGTDIRTKYNLAWEYDGLPFNSTAAAGARPWMGPKFWCPEMVNIADHNNTKVFRYADAILMMAECYLELDDTDNAMRYLNMVKDRAQIARYETFKNYDHLHEEIERERARELFGEFQRKYDLVRWGSWYRQTFDYTDYKSLQDNILPCHEYYPIPDKEVTYSGNALDNDAYAEWGL